MPAPRGPLRLLQALVAALGLLAGLAGAQTAPAVVDLPTRSGVMQRLLVLAPPKPPTAVVVLFAGGHGGLQLSPAGELGWGRGNFLVRSRERFVAQGLAVAVIDAPSDRQSAPYLNGFRQTPEHAADVRAVIAELRVRFGKPVVLVGTSRGTQSVAAVALALRDGGGPDALVLSSTILTDRGASRPVPDLPVESIAVPVLLVHHAADGCRLCAPALLPALAARLRSPHRVQWHEGGKDVGDPCEAWAHHGFNGIEDAVIADIAAWIRDAVVP